MEQKNAQGWKCCVIALVPFAALYGLTALFFRYVYLLEWMSRRAYFGLWLVAGVVAFFRPRLAYAISVSNLLAVLVGQGLGDALRRANMAKITAGMGAEERAYLSLHQGVPIWLCTLALLLAVSLVVTRRREKPAVS